MRVTVEVKGLKKGALYLERVQDSVLLAVDSILVDREEAVVLQANLEHPELFYILLDKNQTDDIDNRIPFFGHAIIVWNFVAHTSKFFSKRKFPISPRRTRKVLCMRFIVFN